MLKFFLFLGVFAFQSNYSQANPAASRLIQLNTFKGSILNLVESTNSDVYHVGTANAEIGFDNYSYNSVGNDDLFILKSNIGDGNNVWLKTFNAGSKGIISPKKIYIDPANNVFIYGQFSGIITIGNATAVSSTSINTFLLKLDSAGNSLWINTFSNSDPTFQYEAKIAADSEDVFLTFSKNHLVRMNAGTGNLIYDKTYDPGIDFRSVALRNNTLYVAGFTENVVAFGTETISEVNKGFIIRGDKSANFNASVQTSGAKNSSISSMAFTGDGSLVFSGFNNDLMSLKSENGLFLYNYNPNPTFKETNTYYYTAKISADLSIITYLRSSTSLGPSIYSDLKQPTTLSSKIISNETSNNYNLIINYLRSSFASNTLTNTNETLKNVSSTTATNSFLIVCNTEGRYPGGSQPVSNGAKLNASLEKFILTNINTRLFTTKVIDLVDGSLKWTKEKTSSKGGALYQPFVKHLKSLPNELFFSVLVEGKSNFFGEGVNNSTGTMSNYISRLGIDGKPKWKAKIENVSSNYGINTSDFGHVDKSDNFLFFCTTSGLSSSFHDANNVTTTFTQPAESPSKVLIKLNKDGVLMWSKQILSLSGKNISYSAVNTDLAGDVYVISYTLADSSFSLDGEIFDTNSIHIIKLNGTTGAIIYKKSYNKTGEGLYFSSFDNNNNLYLFLSYDSMDSSGNYIFDGISVPINSEHSYNSLMLKFDVAGNIVWGKNFYANNVTSSFGIFFDVKFDGNDFAVYGHLYAPSPQNFLGFDGLSILRKYNISSLSYLAKVSTDGTVIWQKPLHCNSDLRDGDYVNIDLDPEKNIYVYDYFKDKLFFENNEYSFDAVAGNKVLHKFDLNGNLKYNIVVDKKYDGIPMIDVIGEDRINVAAKTKEYNILNYPIADQFSSNMYIATFGVLNEKYLSPQKNYLEIVSAVLTNYETPLLNGYYFDLINNVNWTATSDQNWLTLSHERLAEKTSPSNTISDHGDARITINAETNSTGSNRTASILLSGDGGVDSKTIAVTQSGLLATRENKTFVTTLYPNPTSDVLNIETKQTISKIEIFDLSGKLVKSENGKDKKFSVSNLTKGMYLIKLYTENGVVNSKFIKK